MFKKREQKGKGIRRKREGDQGTSGIRVDKASRTSDEDADDVAGSAVVRDVDKTRKRVNAFSTGSGSGKRTAQLGQLLAEQSEGADKHVYGGSATATNEIDTAFDRDARAIAERNLKLQGENAVDADGTRLYRGQAGYKNVIRKDEAQIGNNKNTGTQGPIRAPAFFRATCRFDYQPDICKDYKDTGFCGFGDSCKFMHDRGNYKTGWQMEKEWDEKQSRRKELIAMGVDPDAEDNKDGEGTEGEDTRGEDLPFACHICRGPFVDPVQTKCGHYFCNKCAVSEFRVKGPKCAICEKNTAGIFNACRKLLAHAKRAGGFEALFAAASAAAGDQGVDLAAPTPAADTAPVLPRAPLGAESGSWGVVDEEAEAKETGVAELLEKEAQVKAAQAAAQAEAKAQAEAQAAAVAEAASVKEAAEAAKAAAAESAERAAAVALGWTLVEAHGQRYWFHAAKNMTCREMPLEVAQQMALCPGEEQQVRGGPESGDGETTGNEGKGASQGSTWTQLQDPQGRTYYYNPLTRETSWTPQ